MGGWARIGSDPCEVYLRASDFQVVAVPSEGVAQFRPGSATENGNLAHELLHCLRGYWHPGWDEIGRERVSRLWPRPRVVPARRDREDGQ